MSQPYTLNKTDLMKIGRGALVATGGALLTYLAGVAADVNFTVNYQNAAVNLTPFVTAILSILINAAWKFLQGQEEPKITVTSTKKRKA